MMPGKSQTPALRFAGFTGDWVERKFSQIARLLRGLTYSPSDVQKSGVRVLRSSNICNDSFVLGDDDVFVRESAVNIEKVEDGNILITAANGSSRLVGKHAIVRGVDNFVHGGFMLLAKADNPYFLHASMSSSWYRSFINIFVSGGNGAIGNLRLTDLDCQAVPVPPKTEEKTAIGHFFRKVDALITQQQKKVEKLQGLKKGLMKKMFPRGGRTLPEVRFAGFDEEWVERKFCEICFRVSSLGSDDFLPRVEYEDIISGSGRLNKFFYSKKSSKTGIEFEPGDVLYGKLRPYLRNWLIADFRGFAVGDFWVLRPNDTESDFLYMLIQCSQFSKIANCSTGTKMPRADWRLVSSASFAVPQFTTEQSSIGRLFRKLDDLITLHGQKLEKLRHVKQALLGRMFV